MPIEIYTIALPLVLMALLALVGYWRGVYREAVVGASIVLGALIVQQWAGYDRGGDERWARDLFDMFGGLTLGQWQFVLSVVLLVLVVLVVGYFLGGAIVRQPLSVRSQTLGSLFGLANGAALAGWILRYVYIALDGTSAESAVGQSGVAQGFMIWAGWYPVALALLGAVLALVIPLVRPHPVTIVPASPAVVATTAPVPPTSAFPEPVPTSRVGTASSTTYQSPWAPPATARGEQSTYGQYGYGSSRQPETAPQPELDYRRASAEAPTLAIPTRPVERSEREDHGGTLSYSPPSPPAGPAAAPLPSSDSLGAPAAPPPHTNLHPTSWTSEATTTLPVESSAGAGAPSESASPVASDETAPAGAPRTAVPVEAGPAAGEKEAAGQDTSESAPPEPGAEQPVDRCPNCGAPISANQYFCTECGRRVREPRPQ